MSDNPEIRNYMARKLTTLAPATEINAAMQVLLNQKISGAPVVNDQGHLVGVLSKKDCLKAALNASYFREWGGRVEDYMSAEVQTLDAGMDIVTAAETFLGSPHRRFPVLEDGRLVGQISRADILRALAELWG